MREFTLLLVLLLAVASGWLLGRWQLSRLKVTETKQLPDAYYRGLGYLLDEQPEQAMDMFLQALDDDSESVDTHLALARIFRTRGDYSKATQIHQNLLARPTLASEEQLLVRYELANDYMAAGLLDRAERLLQELLIEKNAEIREKSLTLLLELYQREKDWPQAIETARSLLDMKVENIAPVIAHYYCEQAELCINGGEENEARLALRNALAHDRGCVRAYLLMAQLEVEEKNYKEAIKNLKQIKNKDEAYLAETMPLMQSCYQRLGQQKQFYVYLVECLHDGSLISSGFNASHAMRKLSDSPQQLSESIRDKAQQLPSLQGLRYLIDCQMYDAAGPDIHYLQNLREFVDLLIARHPAYLCKHCGYQGKLLAWLCPGCQQWGTIRPSHTIE